MLSKKIVIAILITTLALFVGGVVMVSRPTKTEQNVVENVDAKLEVTETNYDWGNIDYSGGMVETLFEIKNVGSTTLSLYNVYTSCMCTTAQLATGKVQSPLFGMHTKSDYVLQVEPGDSASLKIVFDPAYHGPSGVGPVTRQIKVSTNDPSQTELDFSLSGVVVKN